MSRSIPVVAAAFVFAAIMPAAAQTAPSASKTAVDAGSAARYKAPRTPWGDPDLQGNYTNVYENGTPLERPQQFEGRRLDEVTGDELRKIKLDVQRRTIALFETPINAPDHWWQDALHLEKGSQAWFVVDPADGRVPPLTAEAQRRAATRREFSFDDVPANSYEDRSLYDRCITRGMPGSMMPAIYGNSYRVVQSQGYVSIQYEMIHETRVIPVDAHPHAGRKIRLDMGDARGHWEGDTLVVETTNFRNRSAFRNADAETLTIVERFTRTAPDQVRWTVTVTDPATWTWPWTFSMPLTMNDSEPMMLYECHEGNYGLRNILSAARAQERAAGQ